MDKRKGVIIAFALLLLFGTGTFVFANPSEEEDVLESTTKPVNRGDTSTNKTDTSQDKVNDADIKYNDNTVDEANGNQNNDITTNLGGNTNNATRRPSTGQSNSSNKNSGSSQSGNTSSGSSSNGDTNNNNTDNSSNSGSGNTSGNNEGIGGGNSGNQGNENAGTGGKEEDVNKPSTGDDDNKTNNDEETIKESNDKIEDALKDLTQDNIDQAKDKIEEIEDEAKKEELLNKLEKLQKILDITKIIDDLANMISTAEDKDAIDDARAFRSSNDINTVLNSLVREEDNPKILEKLNVLKDKMTSYNAILDDMEGPKILGITNGEVINQVNIRYDDTEDATSIKAYFKSKPITIESINSLKTEGYYEIEFVDQSFNKTIITFTIDITAPRFDTIKEFYNKEDLVNKTLITVNDESESIIHVLRDGVLVKETFNTLELGDTYTDGIYQVWITDKAGNTSPTVNFTIDKIAPEIFGVESKTYNLEDMNKGIPVSIQDVGDTTIYLEHNGITNTFEGKTLVIDGTYEDGEYRIYAKDEAGNTSSEISFNIDTKAPVYTNLGVLNYTNLNTDKSLKEAYVGDELMVFVTFLEELGVNPVIKINDITLETTSKEENGLYIYMAKYSVTEDTNLGDVSVQVLSYADKVGNVGENLVNTEFNTEYDQVTIIKKNTEDGDNTDPEPGDKPFEFISGKQFSDQILNIGVEDFDYMTIQGLTAGIKQIFDTSYEAKFDMSPYQPGKYAFKVYNTAGELVIDVEMTYDSKKPTIKINGKLNEDNDAYESVSVLVEDNAIKNVTVYKDGEVIILEEFKTWGNKEYTQDFTENGDYKIEAVDRAGNTSSVEFKVFKKTTVLSRIMSVIGVRF